jgi:hypothetical protein
MSESGAQVSSLTVLGGPKGGTRLVIDEVVDEILVGSDPFCKLCLELPGVSPIHTRLWLDASGLTVHDTHSPRGVFVNDQRVAEPTALRDGDILWLGPPGDPDSVMIQYRAGAPVAPKVAPPPPAGPTGADAGHGADEFFITDAATPTPSPDAADFFVMDDAATLPPTPTPPAPMKAAPPPAPPPAQPAAEDAFFVVDEPVAPAAPPAGAAPPEESFFVIEDAAASPPAPPPPPPPAPVKPTPPAAAAPPVARPPAPQPPPTQPTPAPKPAVAPAGAAPARSTPTPAAPAGVAPQPPAAPRPAAPAPPAARPVTPRAPAARRPGPPAAEVPRARVPPRPSRRAGPRWVMPAAAAVVVLGGGGFAAWQLLNRAPQLETISPARARAGQTVALTGRRFSAVPQQNRVLFREKEGRVHAASDTRIEVEVPELPLPVGSDVRVPVTVEVGGKTAGVIEIALYAAPFMHGVSPDVAAPGDEVSLHGSGWGEGVVVRFGSQQAEIVDARPPALKVRVPALEGPPGSSFPITVVMGAETSNPLPFLLGRLPLVLGAEPSTAAPGDLVTVTGRGLRGAGPAVATVGGSKALVLSVSENEVKLVVPQVAAPGPATLELRVPGQEAPGEWTMNLTPPADPIDLRFVAEPYEDVPGHDHAVVGTGIGPAFVLSASGGRSAADRAYDAARRLNEAAVAIRASLDQNLELRGLDSQPTIGLVGRPDPILEVSEEDAAAYDEDWTKLGGKGGPVTRARLAQWWGALARDLVLLLARGEKPTHAAALAPEGRVLAEVYLAARRSGGVGVPRAVVTQAKPPVVNALRTLALRVPASVRGPDAGPPTAPGTTTAALALKLDGLWRGFELVSGEKKFLNVTFSGGGGDLAYVGGVRVSMPLQQVEQDRKGKVRFSIQVATGMRHYLGQWDGQKLTGSVSTTPDGTGDLGRFELIPVR